MLLHYLPRWERNKTFNSYTYEEQVDHIATGTGWRGLDAMSISQLLDGLDRIPEGKDWLAKTPAFIPGVYQAICANRLAGRQRDKTEMQQLNELLTLSNRLNSLVVTNAKTIVPPP
jgi:hypothetical protein